MDKLTPPTSDALPRCSVSLRNSPPSVDPDASAQAAHPVIASPTRLEARFFVDSGVDAP